MIGRVALFLLPLALTGCAIFGLSAEERNMLAQHQERAKLYYEGNRIPQALDQVQKGLEIAPDDYSLNTIRGYCLLRQANETRYAPTAARKLELLRQAEVSFTKTMALRRLDEHGYQALLGDSLLHEELARWAKGEATHLRQELERLDLSPEERALRRVRLQEFDLAANNHLAQGERNLQELLGRGDQILLAHKHMLNLKTLRGDYEGALHHGRKFLERMQETQAKLQQDYARTTVVGYEAELAQRLRSLVNDDLLVRSQLADLYYDHGDFELASKELTRILSLDPSRSADYYNRARCLHAIGRYDEAYRDTQKFLATHDLPAGHPTVRKGHELLRELERLKQ